MNSWLLLRSEASRATVKFLGQSLSKEHIMFQYSSKLERVYLLFYPPINFCNARYHVKKGKNPVAGWGWYSHISAMYVSAAVKGMIFRHFSLG